MLKKILIVEDDPQLSKVLFRQLEAVGYLPLNAYSGEEGLVLAKKESPDLMVLDIGLPAMDGKTLCEIIKVDPATEDIRIIMLTGERTVGDMEDSFSKGADFYMTKPYDFPKLLARINKVAFVDIQVLAVRNEVFFFHSGGALDDHAAMAFF